MVEMIDQGKMTKEGGADFIICGMVVDMGNLAISCMKRSQVSETTQVMTNGGNNADSSTNSGAVRRGMHADSNIYLCLPVI